MNILQVKKYYVNRNTTIIGQVNFVYSPLGKVFENQIKTIED